ncbi:hypothetical protein SK431_14510, partial [Escherichia coli]|nr:hypothetical protein [Escherichia coli]MDX8108969.1 hypothetical protein [Escherichia coli]
MRPVFILASDNNFFNYGIKSISYTNKKIQCVDFTNIDKLIHKDIASKKYLVCDDSSYYIYSIIFAEIEIKCICIENITLHNGTVGTVAKLAMRQPFVLFKGLTFQKLCLP